MRCRQGFQSADEADFQSFFLDLPSDTAVMEINVVMKGTTGGSAAFRLLDAKFMGTTTTNPTNIYHVSVVAQTRRGRGPRCLPVQM